MQQVPPLAVAVLGRATVESPGEGGMVDDPRAAVAVALARAGYVLVDVVQVPGEQPVTGPGWARVWVLAAQVRAEVLFVDGVAEVAGLEAVAAELRLVVRHLERPRPSGGHPADEADEPVAAAIASGVAPTPPAPPRWARNSVVEDGGITHETVSPLHPTVYRGDAHGWGPVPTEVSLAVTDLCIDGRWLRTRPTVQVEGGSYDLAGARQLRAVLDGFLASVEEDGVSAAS